MNSKQAREATTAARKRLLPAILSAVEDSIKSATAGGERCCDVRLDSWCLAEVARVLEERGFEVEVRHCLIEVSW